VVDGLIDQAPRADCELQIGSYLAGPGGGGLQDEEDGNPPGAPRIGAQRVPYSRCNGLYPWFIYKNRGGGVFDAQPVIKYQPVPLESDTGDAAIVGGYSVTAQAWIPTRIRSPGTSGEATGLEASSRRPRPRTWS
jgi:hypothetical protein